MQADEVLGRVAGMPPGPELAILLASVELAAVPNDLIVDVLRAQARQLAHEQARQFAAMMEVGRTTPGAEPGVTLRAEDIYPWAGGEVAAVLALTARTADRELEFAETLLRHLPAVFAALWAGRLDRGKAWVFADHLHPLSCGLTGEQIDALCAQLVPLAEGWTTGQLAARLLRAIIAIDPDHAARRYTKAVRERQVVGYLAADGTVTITASGLPTAEAAAACERLERLAAAVKRAGHPGRLAQIQADLFCGLLDGRYHQHTQDQIIVDMLARATSTGRPDTSHAEPGGEPTPPGETDQASGADPAGTDQAPGADPPGSTTPTDEPAIVHTPADEPAPDGVRAGIEIRIEIHVPASLLAQLTTNLVLCGRWVGVIGDIAAQYGRRDELTAALDRHPAGRFARGALARHIQVRDRTCSHPGCRRPARKCDLDHTRDFALGGPTTRWNSGPGCDRHHLYKTGLGWQLRQPAPGHFEWRSPLGRTYRTRGEPVSPPLPDPAPRAREPEAANSDRDDDQPMILRLPPPETQPQPPGDDRDVPPF